MNLQTVANAVLILLLVGFIGFRQLKWRPVAVARMWRMPIILGVVGLFLVSSQSKGSTLSTLDVGVLVIEVAVALAIGALMGRIAGFRPLTRTDDPQSPEFESRTGWTGMALWVVMILIRIGIEVWAVHAGSKIAASTGIILVVLAVNRLARTAVFAARLAKLDAVRA